MARTVLFSAAVLPFLVRLALAQAADGPTVGSCTPASYTYTCDSPPCTVVVRPSGDATKSIDNLGPVDGAEGAVSWSVTAAEGDSVTAWITNSKGVTKSNAATVVAAGETDCSSSSSGGSSGGSASKSSSGSSPSAGSASASGSGASTTGGSATSSSSAAEASESADAEGSASGLITGGFLASAMAVAAYLA
ncbi:hypothetical protein JCM11641_001318 [Rhodosporidiobolus odoratus]